MKKEEEYNLISGKKQMVKVFNLYLNLISLIMQDQMNKNRNLNIHQTINKKELFQIVTSSKLLQLR